MSHDGGAIGRFVETRPPAGLGSKSDAFTAVYQDTFSRIVLADQDVRTVLNDETPRLRVLAASRSPSGLQDLRQDVIRDLTVRVLADLALARDG